MNAFKYGCSVDGENFCPRPNVRRHAEEIWLNPLFDFDFRFRLISDFD